ncbi:MAG: hypothetical protein JKY48_17105 [Flavobacteriales bacterium]|nr:hypothetical protein [Flavobacteriales bacterium]
MASRRKFKKNIKAQTDVLIEDAFIESINGDEKEGNKMDQVIDAVIDDRIAMLNKVSNYPNKGTRAEVKAHFNAVKKDKEAKVSDYTKKIGRVG